MIPFIIMMNVSDFIEDQVNYVQLPLLQCYLPFQSPFLHPVN